MQNWHAPLPNFRLMRLNSFRNKARCLRRQQNLPTLLSVGLCLLICVSPPPFTPSLLLSQPAWLTDSLGWGQLAAPPV